MLNNTEMMLINYLIDKEDWVSTAELTMYVNISVRKLRSLVKNINSVYEDKLIMSSNKGYCIKKSKKILDEIVNHSKNQGYSKEKRKLQLLKELLLNENGIDFIAVAEKLFVSEQTILSDIGNLRSELNSYSINLVREGNNIFLEGNEVDIRHLFRNVVFLEVQEELISLEALSRFFSGICVADIWKTVQKTINEMNLRVINDYKMMEIILHFCIILNRKNDCVEDAELTSSDNVTNSDIYTESSIRIMERIEKRHNRIFSNVEKRNIISLLRLCVRPVEEENIDKKNVIIEEKYLTIVNEIVQRVYNEFYVDLSSDDFIDSFSLHLKYLNRNRKRTIKNPLLNEIKSVYPVIYEISVFIMNIIKEELSFDHIDEDETSYIALHVGSQIENQSSNKINTIIINLKYLNLDSIILSKLENNFGESLNIIGVISNPDDIPLIIENQNIDFVISTLPLKEKLGCEVVEVSVFISQQDLNKIFNSITKIKQNKSTTIFSNIHSHHSLLEFFDGTFCYFDTLPETTEDVICELCNQHDDLDSSYYSKVIMREKMSPTEYMNMAIPHPIICNENRTFITVGLFKKPFRWCNNNIDVVFLLSVSRIDRDKFLQIFSELIEIFSANEWKEARHSIDNYKKFISFLETQ